MSTKTMSCLRNLIIVENFFGISRPHLHEDHRIRLICDAISITVLITVTTFIIMDLITNDLSIGSRVFELIVCIEFYSLAAGSRFRKGIFDAMERLDEKCDIDEEYGSKMRTKTMEMILIFLPSFVLDITGLMFLGVNTGLSIFLSVAFAAHDAEMGLTALMIDAVNLRLEKSKYVLPNTGSRVYRHVLLATAHFSEQYTPRLLLMLLITLITTIAYEFIWVLAGSENIIHLSFYLIWREARSIYSLWRMCSAIARSGTACSELSLYLAGRLTQDPSISKENNPSQYKIVQRWYSIVNSQRPYYVSGSIMTLGLSTPILVLDLSINYMLIMVQMYLAYN